MTLPAAGRIRKTGLKTSRFENGRAAHGTLHSRGHADRGRSNGYKKPGRDHNVQLDISQESESESDGFNGVDTQKQDASRPKPNAYASLLKSFQKVVDDQPRVKRRRLDSSDEQQLEDDEDVQSIVSGDDVASLSGSAELASESDGPNILDVEASDAGDESEASDSEDTTDATDPFVRHLEMSALDIARRVKNIGSKVSSTSRSTASKGGGFRYTYPEPAGSPSTPSPLSASDIVSKHVKKRLESVAQGVLSRADKSVATALLNYQDVLYPARTTGNADVLRQLISVHVLNHLLKTRDRILRGNERLARDDEQTDLQIRDQGFTRAKVLFLLATREACARYVKTMIEISQPEQEENKKRFLESYSDVDHTFGSDKPADFRELFEGNADDNFRIGMKFTRKNVKLFSKFYSSDIIFASPLGLRLAIKGKTAKEYDHDFLSSIELVVVDQADAMLMQTWEHVEYCFEHLNLQPKDAHGCDFSRVRHWYLDGQAKHLRQTIALSAYLAPELNSLSNKHMSNIEGKAICRPSFEGAIEQLNVTFSIGQTFSRFQSDSASDDPEARFEHFKATIIPELHRLVKDNDDGNAGLLLFIPSSYDFARLRNFFENSTETRDFAFGVVSETVSRAENQRAGDYFRNGRSSVLLYTGRAHHFYRYKLKGVRKVFMYGLPDNPLFYTEIVGGFLQASIKEGAIDEQEAGVKVMFSRWDALKLERVVGSKRVGAMLKQNKGGDTFDFI